MPPSLGAVTAVELTQARAGSIKVDAGAGTGTGVTVRGTVHYRATPNRPLASRCPAVC